MTMCCSPLTAATQSSATQCWWREAASSTSPCSPGSPSLSPRSSFGTSSNIAYMSATILGEHPRRECQVQLRSPATIHSLPGDSGENIISSQTFLLNFLIIYVSCFMFDVTAILFNDLTQFFQLFNLLIVRSCKGNANKGITARRLSSEQVKNKRSENI